MKVFLKLMIIFSCVCYQNVNAQREVPNKNETQKFTQQQVDSLNTYLKINELRFFNALPNSFEEIVDTLYLDKENALLDYEEKVKSLKSTLPHP